MNAEDMPTIGHIDSLVELYESENGDRLHLRWSHGPADDLGRAGEGRSPAGTG
ncbi:hypothetical protein [Amycolatopsis samaneae]|uniref:Uncharacterized protein n=1 Tax=Amycolatopsis samaneae TaxID=664691 RepID=A0ABW5GX61_9PSEU